MAKGNNGEIPATSEITDGAPKKNMGNKKKRFGRNRVKDGADTSKEGLDTLKEDAGTSKEGADTTESESTARKPKMDELFSFINDQGSPEDKGLSLSEGLSLGKGLYADEGLSFDGDSPEGGPGGKSGRKKKRRKTGAVLIDLDDKNLASIMGTSKRTRKPKERKPRRRGLGGVPFFVYMTTAVVLALAVLGGGTWLFMRIRQVQADEAERMIQGSILLDNSSVASNSRNIIYLEAFLEAGDDTLRMTKASFDDSATVLYFDGPVDFSAFSLGIRDSFGETQGYAPAFVGEDGTVSCPDGGVRFEPLSPGADGFVLTVRDLAAGDASEYGFYFEAVHGLTAEKLFNRVTTVRDGDGRRIATIHSMRFASTGTTMFVTVEDSEYTAAYLPEAGGSAVVLNSLGREVPPAKDPEVYDSGNGKICYRMDYRPVAGLSGGVDLVFSRFFDPMPIEMTAEARRLYMNLDPESYAVFETEQTKVVLERVLTYMDGSYQLVYHAEDMSVPVTGPDDRGNRVEMLLDCEAVITLNTGEELVFPGVRGFSKTEGGNMFFDVQGSPYADAISAGRYRSFDINVKSALRKIPDIKVTVDMGSGYVTDGDIKETLLKHLREDNADMEGYAVSMVAYEKRDENIWAVVREVWTDGDGICRVRTREVSGYEDEYNRQLAVDRTISEYKGLK